MHSEQKMKCSVANKWTVANFNCTFTQKSEKIKTKNRVHSEQITLNSEG